MIHIGVVESVYIGINLVAALLTVMSLIEAERDRRAVKALNGRAREVAAGGNVRREVTRLVMQGILLSLAVPAAFSDRDINLSPTVAVLMAIPAVLLVESWLDGRERRVLMAIVTRETQR